MKGTILKDLYENFCIPKNLAAYIFAFSVTILSALFIQTRPSYLLFTMVVCPMLGACAAEYTTEQDERSNFTKLQITFPITKSQIILAKYLLALGLILCTLFIAQILSVMHVFIFRIVTVPEMFRVMGIGLGFSLIFLSVTYAGFFLLGKHWGTILFVISAAVAGGTFGLLMASDRLESLMTWSAPAVLGFLLIGAAMTALSCLISAAVFNRRYS